MYWLKSIGTDKITKVITNKQGWTITNSIDKSLSALTTHQLLWVSENRLPYRREKVVLEYGVSDPLKEATTIAHDLPIGPLPQPKNMTDKARHHLEVRLLVEPVLGLSLLPSLLGAVIRHDGCQDDKGAEGGRDSTKGQLEAAVGEGGRGGEERMHQIISLLPQQSCFGAERNGR